MKKLFSSVAFKAAIPLLTIMFALAAYRHMRKSVFPDEPEDDRKEELTPRDSRRKLQKVMPEL